MHVQSLFKGVCWPRGPEPTIVSKDGKLIYRYAIVGMLVSDQPIEALEGKNEVVLEGHGAMMAETLTTIPQREPAIPTGDATNVLLSLDVL